VESWAFVSNRFGLLSVDRINEHDDLGEGLAATQRLPIVRTLLQAHGLSFSFAGGIISE